MWNESEEHRTCSRKSENVAGKIKNEHSFHIAARERESGEFLEWENWALRGFALLFLSLDLDKERDESKSFLTVLFNAVRSQLTCSVKTPLTVPNEKPSIAADKAD